MISLPILAAGLFMNIIAAFWFICAVILVLLILIQKGRGGGLSGAFGGGMSSSLLGSKTGDFLTWVTIVLVAVFLILAVVMAKFYKPSIGEFEAPAVAGQTQPDAAAIPVDTTQTPQTQVPPAVDQTTDTQQALPVIEFDQTDINSPPQE
ncbi:MAG: preprotein translocase subunit SecG [Planctomycetota bacterium]|jgi:preprotein translocase subunit SecG